MDALIFTGFIHSISWLITEYCINRNNAAIGLRQMAKALCLQAVNLGLFVFVLELPYMLAIVMLIVFQALIDYAVFENNMVYSLFITALFFVSVVYGRMLLQGGFYFLFKGENAAWLDGTVTVLIYVATVVGAWCFSPYATLIHDTLHIKRRLAAFLVVLNGFFPMLAYGTFAFIKSTLNPAIYFVPRTYKIGLVVEIFFSTMVLFYFVMSFLLLYYYIKYKNKSEFDDMTKIYNKTAGLHRLNLLLQKSRVHQKPLAVAFIDVDALKKINDAYGHDMGDIAIIKATEMMLANIRQTDALFRYGGDEFVLVLYDSDEAVADKFFARIEEALLTLSASEDYPFVVTFSYGVQVYKGRETVDAETLIMKADQEMYRRKFSKKVPVC